MDHKRPQKTNNDWCLFDFSESSKNSLSENKSALVRDSETLGKKAKHTLPDNAMIFLSGTSGVGKTTIARNLMKLNREITVMQEIDLLREAIRSNTETIANKLMLYLKENVIKSNVEFEELLRILNYGTLTKSTSELSYDEMLLQAHCVSEPLKRICLRLREKKMPAILEGVNLPFEALFTPFDFHENFYLSSSNMLFINLYLSDEKEHKRRIQQRALDRGLSKKELSDIMKNFPNIRQQNILLHQKALYYSDKISNIDINGKKVVHSIDISGNPKLSFNDNTYQNIQKINALIKNWT